MFFSQAMRVTALAALQILPRRGHPCLARRTRIRVCWINWLKRNLTAKQSLGTNETTSLLVRVKLLVVTVRLPPHLSVCSSLFLLRHNICFLWTVFLPVTKTVCHFDIISRLTPHAFAHLSRPCVLHSFCLIYFVVHFIYLTHSLCLENTLPL